MTTTTCNGALTKATPVIELRGVSKFFDNKPILDEADLEIYPGDALAIIGPSGTGKSTILRAIAGLMPIDSGEIYVNGKLRKGLIEESTDPLAISMVFQQAALFDSLTVAENVGFALYQHSQLPPQRIQEIVDYALELVGLPGAGPLMPSELSGGMRKRVSFARAVMHDPDNRNSAPSVVLYDEPTAGLDPIASTVIEDLVRYLQRDVSACSTYVMVSHQESTIRRTGDRILFLYQGKFQWSGSVSELDTTDNPLVRQFLSASVQGPIKVAPARRV
ncbi:ABC-type transport system ATPase component [Rubidibacter lacunae KORDI 51-2]|uniref:ABC-type transport system ATPase component n=1 Tax=Rubidibacter lacunae KORDI 51-2 TaxID=582515 RepID=U5DGN6_9CHRO|nr:ATP-binding cassette domain-containing protein [Rubidibacter lacunae]ERN40766.1 ABC-type transport system ATPase component [Rubidibacter lacunae KORDI 51-2]